MRKWPSLLLFLMVAHLSLTSVAQEAERCEYPDVPRGHWATDAILSLSRSGFIEGMPDGTYAGTRAITRSEFAVILARFNRDELPDAVRTGQEAQEESLHIAAKQQIRKSDYPDLPSGHWASDSIAALTRAGILQGLPDGTFGLVKPLTRYECAIALTRWLDYWSRASTKFHKSINAGIPSDNLSVKGYPDVAPSHPAFQTIRRLQQLRLLHGFGDGHFHGHRAITRYEFAALMGRVAVRVLTISTASRDGGRSLRYCWRPAEKSPGRIPIPARR